mmetsp:Transcript_7736/g.22017  ORF Transcript_7736/g.22017 Transcript_7736/m.22017 type:complete len:228 (-) Transcript_7736:163-846(-)
MCPPSGQLCRNMEAFLTNGIDRLQQTVKQALVEMSLRTGEGSCDSPKKMPPGIPHAGIDSKVGAWSNTHWDAVKAKLAEAVAALMICIGTERASGPTRAASADRCEAGMSRSPGWSSMTSDNIARQDHTAVSSAGSARHAVGSCKPCALIRTAEGCAAGAGCRFCHLPHSEEGRPRMSKSRRDRLRKVRERNAERLAQPSESDSTGGASVCELLAGLDRSQQGNQAA